MAGMSSGRSGARPRRRASSISRQRRQHPAVASAGSSGSSLSAADATVWTSSYADQPRPGQRTHPRRVRRPRPGRAGAAARTSQRAAGPTASAQAQQGATHRVGRGAHRRHSASVPPTPLHVGEPQPWRRCAARPRRWPASTRVTVPDAGRCRPARRRARRPAPAPDRPTVCARRRAAAHRPSSRSDGTSATQNIA